MKNNITLVFLLIVSVSFAQQEYKLVKSEGIIPDEIISLNKLTYNHSIDTVKGTYNEIKDQKEFLLRSNYELGNLLKSGKILFGDKFTKYVSKVGDNLLKSRPDLKDKIKFYVVKSADVNAFSTQQGYLFVNLGLLAQVENEAQLAFVLAHEIAHYAKKHTVEKFMESKKMKRGSGEYRRLSSDELNGSYKKYSKENEFEADREGFEGLFLKAGYDVNEALNIFDVLLYSYLPVDEIEFDTAFFNDEYFKISNDYFVKEFNEITAVEDYDDSDHTHPNIKKRRENFIDYVTENDVEDGVKFLFDETTFAEIQTEARYELSNLHTINTYYGAAIYNSYLLLKKNPNDLFLRRNMSYNLYALSKYKTYKSIRDVLPRDKKVEGKSQQVYRIFNKIEKEELNILALKYNWKLYKETGDAQFKRQYKDLLKDLTFENEQYVNSFKLKAANDSNTVETLTKEEYEKLSKYQKIKYDKKKTTFDKTGGSGIEFSMVDILNDQEFFKEFKSVSKKAKEEKEKEESNESRKKDKKNKKNRIKTINNGIDSVLISNPFFGKYNYVGDKIYIDSEERELEFIELIKIIAKSTNVEANVLDVYELNNQDIDKFNQIAQFNTWMSEFSNHQDYNELWTVLNSQDEFMKGILHSYKMRYFSFAGTFTKEKSPKVVTQYFYVVDSESGEIILTNYSKIPSYDYNAPIKSFLYDSFINLKRNYN